VPKKGKAIKGITLSVKGLPNQTDWPETLDLTDVF
jgi:hypothetical protein